jgi:hypothetical protein
MVIEELLSASRLYQERMPGVRISLFIDRPG